MNITIALLQGALGGALIFILALVLIVVVAFLGGAFGGGALDREPGEEGGEITAPRVVPPGTISASIGLGLSAIGAYFGAIEFSALGIMLGAFGYYRGARYLGIAVMLLSLAAIFVGQNLGYQTSRFGF